MTTPVEPCPFCEGLSMFCVHASRNMDTLQLLCSSCGALGPVGKTREEAADKWNRRETGGYKLGDMTDEAAS